MLKSDSIAALAAALAKAQGSTQNAKKDADNPFFKSKYADLASVWDVCREPLAANGLSVCQLPSVREGRVILTTVLMHSSGEWISEELEMTPTKQDPQGVGSAITYARRYALAACAGVATEDDDGNAASGPQKAGEARKAPPPPAGAQKQPPRSADAAPAVGPKSAGAAQAADSLATPKQCAWLHQTFREALIPELQKDADFALSMFLADHGYGIDGTGSAKAVPQTKLKDVANAAVARATELNAAATKPFEATNDDIPF